MTTNHPSPTLHTAPRPGGDARRRIVILGGGFGGAYAAQHLGRRLKKRRDVEILLLDRNNYFIFYPLLVEAGTGQLEPRHAVVPIRDFLDGPRSEFRMAEVIAADPKAQTVTYEVAGGGGRHTVDYDHLVVALGSVTRMPAVPGLRDYGFQMKSLNDAVSLRDRAIHLLEIANTLDDPHQRRALLHFVVVGSNFSGIEVAGEFQVFLSEAAKLYPNIKKGETKVTMVEMAGRILPALDADLAQFAHDHLTRRGMDIRLNATVQSIEPDHVALSTGEELASHTVIWCAGIAANPRVDHLGLPVDSRGYILCERDLRVKGFENVWAIGDTAVNIDKEGKAYPATAQHAVQQAKALAANIAAVYSGKAAKPCDAVSKGTIAALGCRTGVANVFGVKLSGFVAWWLWRSVYLMKMPTLRRKIRVALDWTIDLFFGKDYVQLGVHRPRMSGDAKEEDRRREREMAVTRK